jgi:hypothetical protein
MVGLMAGTSTAHPTITHKKPFSKMSLRELERYQIRLINLDRWIIRTRRVHLKAVVDFARHRIRWTRRELRETRSHFVSSSAGHYRGWLCIHLGPSFNSTGPHEGNSSSGTYTGPLQMTNPWLGQSAPGGSWAAAPLSTVFAIAERVARRYGFSSSFMAGQWPNTYPPCAGYF